jgi:hypothetical protein
VALVALGLATLTFAGFSGGPLAGSLDLLDVPLQFKLFSQGATAGNALLWNLGSLGLLLPLGLLALLLAPRRARLFLGLLIVSSLVLTNFFEYRYGWHIVAFLTVAQLALGLLSGLVIDRVWRPGASKLGRSAAAPLPLPRALVGAILAAGCAAGGVLFLVPIYASKILPSTAHYFFPQVQTELLLGAEDRAAADWLASHVGISELIYRRKPYALAYAMVDGLAMPWHDAVTSVPIDQERLVQRDRLFSELPHSPAAYLAAGLRWFVLEPADADGLGTIVKEWASKSLARLTHKDGDLEIYELLPATK